MITSGFFPSVNGDRKQTGSFLAQWIHSLVSNGVYDGDFAVTAGENMSVKLPIGQAWINGYYCRNDGNITLPIANADGVLKRRDTVVLRWDINTRDITAKVLTGTFASNPVAPAITRNVEQYDLKIAEISIPAGTTAITQSLITDTRLDNSVCGIVHAVVDHIDTTTLFNQLQAYIAEHEAQFSADMAAFESQSETDFNAWFSGIKTILDESTAGNLLNLINEHKADTAAHTTQADHDKINGAIRSATIGGAAVPLDGNTLQLPAYPTSAKKLYTTSHPNDHSVRIDWNGADFVAKVVNENDNTDKPILVNRCIAADTASCSNHWISSGGTALRNITMSTAAPSGGQDGDVWHQYS